MESNIVVLDIPVEVDTKDWAIKNPNCSALFEKNASNSKRMKIIAYSLNKTGDEELNNLPFAFNDNVGFFRGIDEAQLNRLGGIV